MYKLVSLKFENMYRCLNIAGKHVLANHNNTYSAYFTGLSFLDCNVYLYLVTLSFLFCWINQVLLFCSYVVSTWPNLAGLSNVFLFDGNF